MTQEPIITSEEADHLADALIQLENAEGELRLASILAQTRKAKGGLVDSIEETRASLRQLIDTLTIEIKQQESNAKNANTKPEPVTVTTVKELDQLPAQTVIKDKFGNVYLKAEKGYWVYGQFYYMHSNSLTVLCPAAVIYRPDEQEAA